MPNVQPLYKGGPSFPLTENPYFSRTEGKNVDFDGNPFGDPSANYQSIAYRPGFSLQASELNEIQENFQMQMSLTIAMMHNWITSGTGKQWTAWNANSPGGEGGQWDPDYTGFPPNTGIGFGGSEDGTYDQNYTVSGPGWRGATPLHPFYSPYQGGTHKSVSYSKIGNEYNFTFNPGWWLVESKGYWVGNEDDQPDPTNGPISGLKHWIYLDQKIEKTVTTLDLSNTDWDSMVVGLVIQGSYVTCLPDPNHVQDPDLADNATGIPNSASPGADRYALNFVGEAKNIQIKNNAWTGPGWPIDFQDRENMNPVCVIRRNEGGAVRYMNNLKLANDT